MEEVVAFFARNLEADDAEPEPFSMHNGLPAFTAAQERCKSHESPPKLGCDSLQVVSERLRSLSALCRRAQTWPINAEHSQVVDSDACFGFVLFQKSLDDRQFLFQRSFSRILWQESDLSYEVIPREMARDRDGKKTFLSIPQMNIRPEKDGQQERAKNSGYNAHGDFLPLCEPFWPHGSGSFRLPSSEAFRLRATVSPKRFPINFRSSSPERNRSSVHDSTS